MNILQEIIKNSLSVSMSYEQYRNHITDLVESGKTTGINQSEDLLKYTILNVQRMNKWDKHFKPDPEIIDDLKSGEARIWLAISEAWCGDAAHVLPVLNHLAKNLPNVELRIVLRDQNAELMDNFLSNGSRSIPMILNIAKNDLKVEAVWGSRPASGQRIVDEGKKAGLSHEDYTSALQIWYSRNRGVEIQKEIGEKMLVVNN